MTSTISPTVTPVRPTADLEDRRRCLRRLAEECRSEQGWKVPGDFSPVVHLLVPTLAAGAVSQPLPLFERLVAALHDFQSFCNDEATWLHLHEQPSTLAVREAAFNRLESDIDFTLDQLMGRR